GISTRTYEDKCASHIHIFQPLQEVTCRNVLIKLISASLSLRRTVNVAPKIQITSVCQWMAAITPAALFFFIQTPTGQAASYVFSVAIENHISHTQVVALVVQKKLCWTGSYLSNRNFEVEYQDGHAGCIATLQYMEPPSERKIDYVIAEEL
ncbi:hypothetical protein MAR_019327, partial [Mya arenaria]